MRILVLIHRDLLPPENTKPTDLNSDDVPWETEYDVISTLRKLKHEVHVLGVAYDLSKIRAAIEEIKPTVVFNLLEEFHGEAIFDQNVVSYLELLKASYTGCNPRGLILSRDKALTKKILTYHRIPTPRFAVFPRNQKRKRPMRLGFPLIVKCINEEASMGIAQSSLVSSDDKLVERVDYLQSNLSSDVIAEEFIEGREFFVGLYGNFRLSTLPIWELSFSKSENPEKMIYSERAKFSKTYRQRYGIKTAAAKLPPDLEKRVFDLCKRTYRTLNMNGYARIDLRITDDERIFVIEANPNPDIAKRDEFAKSAKYAGMPYEELLGRILRLARQWSPTKPLPRQIVT